MTSNEAEGVCYSQPTSLPERIAIANDFKTEYEYAIPLVVDTMGNGAMDAYAGWPERLYIIDESGQVAYKGGLGPFGFSPGKVESWLEERFGQE